MMYGIAAFLLVVVALGGLLWPLWRRRNGPSSLDHAVRFYAARREELARQRDAGLIDPAEARAAEAEQARQLLALEAGSAPIAVAEGAPAIRRRKVAALLVLVLVPVIGLGTYAWTGRPFVPDLPLASRAAPPAGGLDLADAVRRVEAHLARNPDDGKGYEVIAPVYLRAGRFADAARAYRRVIDLLGPSATRHADYAEALVAAAGGTITADARVAFEAALAADPDYAKAEFYLALALDQDGRRDDARKKLEALSARQPEGPAKMRIEAELERFRLERAAPAVPQGGEGLAALPRGEQEAAIRGMVDGLAQRLESQGGSLEEWLRLVRARFVLGEREAALRHLAAARRAFEKDATGLARLNELAAALGAETAGDTPGSRP